jgi:hypothetical protein
MSPLRPKPVGYAILISLANVYEPKVRVEEFQLWTLKVRDNATGVVSSDDGYRRIIYKQALDFTDFPERDVKLYFCNRKIPLPSGY